MVIISDTSPITNLIRLDLLDILGDLFDEVIIPQKVYEELIHYENQKEAIEERTWMHVEQVSDRNKVSDLENQLDAGEAEAIILAKELNADLLIMDERKGRKIAEEQGLKIIGLLGLLIKAKQQGFISELKPLLNDLIENIGFRVSEQLYNRVLREINE